MKDMTVSKALQWLFIAEILMIFKGLGVIGAILGIVAFVLNLLALYGASKLDNGYHMAFVLSIVGIVVSIVSTFAGNGFFATLVTIISNVAALGILYYVVTTTCKHLDAAGAAEVSGKGQSVWKINLICTIISVVLSLLMYIPIINVLAAVVAVIVGIVMLVAYILYLIFLWKGHKALA